MKRERAAAFSAVGLMLIAGCSGGGRSAGTMSPLPAGGGSQGAASTPRGNATLQIMIPPQTQMQGPQSLRAAGRRTSGGIRYATSARRHPTWLSPFSAYANLTVVPASGGPTYQTSFALSSCTEGTNPATYESYYNCSVSVPYGSNFFYLSMYDLYNNLLSTNVYASPAAQTVNPNGSSATNTISIYEQGVVSRIDQESPVSCWAAYPQAVFLDFKDADGTPIYGPLANPITPKFTAYDGTGLGAIAPYAVYLSGSYGTFAVNNQTLYDTSIYFPYLWISGQEGAVNVAATVANIPVYNNGALTYSATSGTPFATGTYIAWGIGAGGYNLYPVAVQRSTNYAIACDPANGTFQQWTYVGAILDPVYGTPYIVASDPGSNLHVYDGLAPAVALGHSYLFFQTPGSGSYNNAGLNFWLQQPLEFSGSVFGGNLIDFFTSPIVKGRVDVLSTSTTPGHIDLIDVAAGTYGAQSDFPTRFFTTAVTLYGNTRLAGSSVSSYLYYDQPGSAYLLGEYVVPYSSVPSGSIDFSSYTQITGQIYTISPSGPSSSYIFVRGASSTGAFYLCEFDSNPGNFALSISNCYHIGSYNSNPASLTFDPGSGDLMFSAGYTGNTGDVYALPANQAPTTFAADPFAGYPSNFYQLQSQTFRFTPTTATPGIVGLYGGPQSSGPCTGTGEVTWLSYSSGAFHYIASLCWPNHYIALTYPY
jgi:hypothetical protein